jgi:hypothetical protein
MGLLMQRWSLVIKPTRFATKRRILLFKRLNRVTPNCRLVVEQRSCMKEKRRLLIKMCFVATTKRRINQRAWETSPARCLIVPRHQGCSCLACRVPSEKFFPERVWAMILQRNNFKYTVACGI